MFQTARLEYNSNCRTLCQTITIVLLTSHYPKTCPSSLTPILKNEIYIIAVSISALGLGGLKLMEKNGIVKSDYFQN